jgi:hypothetical protein
MGDATIHPEIPEEEPYPPRDKCVERTCTDDVYWPLRKELRNRGCKSLKGCDKVTDPNEALDLANRHLQCGKTRKKLNDCWQGGNWGHVNEYNKHVRAMNSCFDKFNELTGQTLK